MPSRQWQKYTTARQVRASAMLKGLLAVMIGALLLFASAQTAAAATAIERGKAFVTSNCGTCHAIGPTGASRNPKAPPFRVLSTRYPLEHLEEAFAEGIVVSHRTDGMPAFRLEPQSIADMIEYMKSIGAKGGKSSGK